MKVCDTNHVADFRDLCPTKSADFVADFVADFPRALYGLNSIRATQMYLSRTCHELCCKHLDMSRLIVSASFMICVRDFPRREVSVKVGVMEFGRM